MPDIEKRLEAFVRLGHGILVFPGGVGTAEEILYLMGILLHPDNADMPFPFVLTGPKESREYFEQIDHFLHRTYAHAPKGTIDYKYKWHGLMGYTPNGVRVIGPEPLNPVLLYNLGCNGVGILPSIYGSQKISWFLAGRDLPPSIFDPKDFRVKK